MAAINDAPKALSIIQQVNTKLVAFAANPVIRANLSRPTVQAALTMWAGNEPAETVDLTLVGTCDGVRSIYPFVREMEIFCDSCLIKVPVDHMLEGKTKLDDKYLIGMFGLDFCRQNQLLSTTSTAPVALPPSTPPPMSPPSVQQQSPTSPPPTPPVAMTPAQQKVASPLLVMPGSEGGATGKSFTHIEDAVTGAGAEAVSSTPVQVTSPAPTVPTPPAAPVIPTMPVKSAIPPPTPVAKPAPAPASSQEPPTENAPSVWPTIIAFIAVILTSIMQNQIKKGAALTAPLPWVGSNNATAVIGRQMIDVEKAHINALTSSAWKVLRSETNLTVETLAEAGQPKYTKLSVLLSNSPQDLYKKFDKFVAFDRTHSNVLPLYQNSELLSSPSARETLMKITTMSLPLISGYESTLAVVGKKTKSSLKLDNVVLKAANGKAALPSAIVVPSGTFMTTVASVNSKSNPTKAPVNPLVTSCDQYGQLLSPNSTLCTAAVDLASTPGNLLNSVALLLQPPSIKTKIDAVYWFVPVPTGGTLMVAVVQGLGEMLAQSMGLSYSKTLGK